MLAYLLIICVAFYVVATSSINLVGEYLFNQKVREEQRLTESLAATLAPYLYARDAEGLYRQAVDASRQNNGRVVVLDEYGVAQADAYSELNGQRIVRSEVAQVLSSGASAYGYYERTAGNGEQPYRMRLLGGLLSGGATVVGVYTAAISVGGQGIGALLYISSAEEMYNSLIEIQDRMILWMVVTAVAVALISLFFTRLITKPVAELNEGIVLMSRGDFSSRVKVRGHSEFAQLASAFNMMCERLESLDRSRNQFVSNASHELKTPLSTMKILLETLLYQENYDPEMQKEFLLDINKEIDRLNRIISDLLTLVHIDGGEMRLKLEPVALTGTVSDTLRRLAPLARERGIELESAFRDDIVTLADEMKLQQVVYNLIDNAIKYTPRGGSVKVDLAKNGKMAVLKVSDTGMGIPKQDLLHVFDRFYRVDKARSRETGGTGLGLSIVKQIVSLHQGNISVVSEEDKGSTFTVELPIRQQ